MPNTRSIYDEEFCAAILKLADHKPLLKTLMAQSGKSVRDFMESMPSCPIKREIFKECGHEYPADITW